MGELTGRVHRVADLDAETRTSMFVLYEQYYGGTAPEIFHADLADKHFVVILRDEAQVLQGFSSLKVWEQELAEEPVRIMYSGDTIVHSDYWGQQALAFTWINFSGALKAEAPDVPLYWFLLVKGHRTYRYLIAFYRVFYPAYNRSTPPHMQAFLDQLATAKFGEFYDPRHGIVHFPTSRGHLKDNWADIPEKDLRRPDVQFFLERNPGYAQGDELVCLTELSSDNQKPLAARLFAAGFNSGLDGVLDSPQ